MGRPASKAFLNALAKARKASDGIPMGICRDDDSGPFCRDCADHDGTCQSDGVTPCDPKLRRASEIVLARIRAKESK